MKIIKKEWKYVISHKEISKHTWVTQKHILRYIQDNKEDLEFFWVMGFENTKPKENWWRPEKIYFLNEPQSTLLITYMRNNDKVKEFKKNLVKWFYELQHKVLSQQEIIYQLQIEKNKLMQQYCPNTFTLETNEVLYDNWLYKWN